jgi:SAM-dependent methyltransferase
MDLKSTYNRIAEDWHRGHQQDDWWVAGTDAFASCLKRDATVLDVGCGAGLKANYLMNKGLAVTGIDFSEKMIALAKRDVPRGSFYVQDMYAIGGIPETFDGVFAQAVLLHVPKNKIVGVITSLAAKVNPGGYLYVGVKEKRPYEKEEEVVVENDYGYPYERFFSYYTLPEMKSYFQNAGLEICYESANPSGKRTWIQVVGRKPA